MSNGYDVLIQLNPEVANHITHPWRKVGRCVYCPSCKVRLYSGTLPANHPVAPNPPRHDPSKAMRERWGK